MNGKWGIIVAVGTDRGECESLAGKTQDEGARPSAMGCKSLVPIALGSVWSVFTSVQFLYLVTSLGARRYIFKPGQNGIGGSYRIEEEEPHPSVDAATREYKTYGHGVRLLLVHLDAPERFLHPGLLPWLSRFAPAFDPKEKTLPRVTELLSTCLDPDRKDAVFLATLMPGQTDNWLQWPWNGLMERLTHKRGQASEGVVRGENTFTV